MSAINQLVEAVKQGNLPQVSQQGDVRDKKGKPFRQLALESGNEEIIKLFN